MKLQAYKRYDLLFTRQTITLVIIPAHLLFKEES